jgi:hypothetical protein
MLLQLLRVLGRLRLLPGGEGLLLSWRLGLLRLQLLRCL